MILYALAIASPTHSDSRRVLARLAAAGDQFRQVLLYRWTATAVRAPVRPCVDRFSWTSGANRRRRLVREFGDGDARADGVSAGAGQEFPAIRRPCGESRLGQPHRLCRVGRAAARRANLDGSVVPCAVAGSLMLRAGNHDAGGREMHDRFGDRLYGRYGFADAFHPAEAGSTRTSLASTSASRCSAPKICVRDGSGSGSCATRRFRRRWSRRG